MLQDFAETSLTPLYDAILLNDPHRAASIYKSHKL